MTFRFIHTADLHLDSPLRSLALRNPDLADLVRGATRSALQAIVDLCVAESVDALLIAGDLYDGSQTSMNTALFLAAEMRRLEAAGIAVFVIRGNHDSQSAMTREITFPANVHVFSGRTRCVCAKTIGHGRTVYIHGVSFAQPHAPDSLLPLYQAPVADAVNIGMMHTSVDGTPGHDRYAPCSLTELVAHGFDYWALGHVHQRRVHSERPLIVMPGMPQGRDINEAGQKTVTLVTVNTDGQLSHEERTVGIAAFSRLAVDLTGVDDWTGMLEKVGAAIETERRSVKRGHLILRLELTGATSLGWTLRRDPDFLFAEVTNVAAGLNDCWIEKVDIHCRPADAVSRMGPDPVEELSMLIRKDVLTAHGFRQQTGQLVVELLAQLPRDVRELLASDETALEELTARLAEEGSDDVLAALQGGAAEAAV